MNPDLGLRMALWSSGQLEIISGKTRLILSPEQCGQLRAYLTLAGDL